jgi:hypothetical protein
MTASVQTLTRVFRFGATELPDIDPSMPPEAVLKHYSGAYPFLGMATVAEPEVSGDRIIYPVRKREAQTKGAGLSRLTRSQVRALDALSALEAAPMEDTTSNCARWTGLHQYVRQMLHRPATPIADAMSIPML